MKVKRVLSTLLTLSMLMYLLVLHPASTMAAFNEPLSRYNDFYVYSDATTDQLVFDNTLKAFGVVQKRSEVDSTISGFQERRWEMNTVFFMS
jgi:hypothetical protein